jgi:hypothetical protein
MCEHLIELENYIIDKNIKEIFRGKSWSENCREWVYYDCVFNIDRLKKKFNLSNCVIIHEYNDIKIANELGFYCNSCKDAIIGFSPSNKKTKDKIMVE